MQAVRRFEILVAALALLCSALFVSTAFAGWTGMVGANFGAASGVTTPLFNENGGPQLFTVGGVVMATPSSAFVIVADASFAFSPTYTGETETFLIPPDTVNATEQFDATAFYADLLAGVHRSFEGGGYVYVAAGVAIGTASLTTKIVRDIGDPNQSVTDFETEFDTVIGPSFGAGIGLPIAKQFMGYVTFRQRILTAEGTFSRIARTAGAPGANAPPDQTGVTDTAIGGFELAAGIGWGF